MCLAVCSNNRVDKGMIHTGQADEELATLEQKEKTKRPSDACHGLEWQSEPGPTSNSKYVNAKESNKIQNPNLEERCHSKKRTPFVSHPAAKFRGGAKLR